MDLEIIILSEISQTETNITRYCLCVESKNNGTNEPIFKSRNRVTDVENKFMVARGFGGDINWDPGIDIHTVIYINRNE